MDVQAILLLSAPAIWFFSVPSLAETRDHPSNGPYDRQGASIIVQWDLNIPHKEDSCVAISKDRDHQSFALSEMFTSFWTCQSFGLKILSVRTIK